MNRSRRFFCTMIVIVTGIWPGIVSGESSDLLEPWRWVRFTVDDGLPANRVVKICETTSGRLWVSTTAGIAWYDGYRWVDSDLELETSRKESHMLSPDRDGGVLAIIDQKLYQGDEQGLHAVPLHYVGTELHIHGAIPSLDGGLIILAWHPQRFEQYLLRRSVDGTLTPFPLSEELAEGIIHKIWGMSDDAFWLHATKGLYRYEQGIWRLLHATNAPQGDVDNVMSKSGEGFVTINHSYRGHGLWSWKEGESPRLVLGESKGRIEALAISPSGDVLVGYDSGVVHLRHDYVWSDLLPIPYELTGVNTLAYRSNGDLVVGTERGLFLHRARFPLWDHWKNPEPDSTDRIHAFTRARDGSLWIASSDGVERRHLDGRVERFAETGGRSLRDSTGIAEDQSGNIWVCSGGSYEGAFRYDGTAWKHFGATEGLPGLRHRIYPDRQGRLWFVGLGSLNRNTVDTGHGAAVYDGTRFEHWTVERGLLNDRVYAFAEGNEGELWFGTGGGLCRWKNGQWTYWDHTSGLRASRIWSIAIDMSNTLWFADQKYGLGRIVGDTPEYLSLEEGLPDNEIHEIRADPSGGIWLTCSGSIARYRNGRWNVFDSMAGIGHSNMWPIHVELDRVYVGTFGNGTAILNRRALEDSRLKVFLDEPIIGFETVNLRWRVSSMDQVIAARHIETRYRLDDEEWSDWLMSNRAILSIAPGRHEMTLQARSRIAESPFTEVRLPLMIPYPLYRHPIVIAIGTVVMLFIIALILFAVIHMRRSTEALRESELRFRNMAESSPVMIWMSDANRKCIYLNKSWLKFRGCTMESEIAAGELGGVHPDDIAEYKKVLDETFNDKSEFRLEYRLKNAKGEYRWVTDCGAPRFTPYGEFAGYIGTCVDFTERKMAEETLQAAHDELDKRVAERTDELHRKNQQERLLFNELDHRVRNNLSSLIALLDITGHNATSIDAFACSIRGRIEAMAAIHTVLSQSQWKSMKLSHLIQVITPYDLVDCIELDGHDIEILPRQATAFGMVIHELITNSIKHGSLGMENGIIKMSWRTSETTNREIKVNWRWKEQGGPLIEPKITPGVGYSLIEGLVQSELRGIVKLTFATLGVDHQFSMILDIPDLSEDGSLDSASPL